MKRGIPLLPLLAGLLLIQLALPKFLPLPGISDRWWVIVVGGGFPGVLASLVGGVVVLAYGLTLLPTEERSPQWWAVASAVVAVVSRAAALLLALLLTGELPSRFPWEADLPVVANLAFTFALVALLYGSIAGISVALMRRARDEQSAAGS